MKVINFLVISLVVVVGSLFLFNEKISAQMLVDGGDVVWVLSGLLFRW